jgi:ribosomal protein S18 acetylase RimI-like enzyme
MLREETNLENLRILTKMNISLRAAEQMDNQMSDAEVEIRMKDFISGTQYRVFTIWQSSDVIGYAVIDVTRKPPYLRQLFISEKYRRFGNGKNALADLCKILATDHFDVEVMSWNTEAIKFYEKNGFKKRVVGLRL